MKVLFIYQKVGENLLCTKAIACAVAILAVFLVCAMIIDQIKGRRDAQRNLYSKLQVNSKRDLFAMTEDK